jgi:hypothetical protein
MVKFFVLKGVVIKPESVQGLKALAYRTAREPNLHPKEILIRFVELSSMVPVIMLTSTCSGLGHNTSYINGEYRPDPLGNHFTFCFKNDD